MHLFDTLLRGIALGLALMAVAGLLGDARTRTHAAAPVALFLTVSCYLLVSGPSSNALPAALKIALVFGAICVPVALTWFTLDVFIDAPSRRWPWLAVAGVTIPLALAAPAFPVLGVLRGLVVLGLYLSLMGLAIATSRSDLVEARRNFRPVFVLMMTLLGAVITVVEISGAEAELPVWVLSLQAASIALLALSFGLWVFVSKGTIWAAAEPDRPLGRPEADAEERWIAERLHAALESGAWRTEGLTIGALADQVGVPEHKLRRTINQRLGHRNFPSFINGYRIEAAKAALADPDRAGETILEIAFESGFSSLGPFNKAFRAETGQSPREFRRAALASIPENSV